MQQGGCFYQGELLDLTWPHTQYRRMFMLLRLNVLGPLCRLTVFNTHSQQQCQLQSDATTGWNFATTPDSRSLKQLLTRSLASSIKNSKDHTTALKDYRTPQQNAAAVADKIKTAHLEAVQQVTALEAKFGKEGAAEVIRIARMPQTHNNHSHQVRTVLVSPVGSHYVANRVSGVCHISAVNISR